MPSGFIAGVPAFARRATALGVIATTLGLAYGIWYSYSVILVALLAEFQWSRSLLAGAFSLVRVQRVLRDARGARLARSIILAAIVLSGFGIYLGRFERLNSWDLILHPWTVLMRCLASIGPRAVVVTAASAALLAVTYVSVLGQWGRPKRSR